MSLSESIKRRHALRAGLLFNGGRSGKDSNPAFIVCTEKENYVKDEGMSYDQKYCI